MDQTCPNCKHTGSDFKVYYSAPLLYDCPVCTHRFADKRSAITVVSGEEARMKRPKMYKEEAPVTVIIRCRGEKDCKNFLQVDGTLVGFETPTGPRGWTPVISYHVKGTERSWDYDHKIPEGWKKTVLGHVCPACVTKEEGN